MHPTPNKMHLHDLVTIDTIVFLIVEGYFQSPPWIVNFLKYPRPGIIKANLNQIYVLSIEPPHTNQSFFCCTAYITFVIGYNSMTNDVLNKINNTTNANYDAIYHSQKNALSQF